MQPFAATRESLASIVTAGRITVSMVPKSRTAASGMNPSGLVRAKRRPVLDLRGWTSGCARPNLGR